jgi:hypothetical protein
MINLTREEAQQMLDALKHLCLHTAAIAGYDGEKVQPPIDMLKAKLKQPENSFSPDWDAMVVMVEEQQRMAKRIEELTQLVTSQGIRLMDAEAQPEPTIDGWPLHSGLPQPEPVAWSVTWNGQHTGNIFVHPQEAKDELQRLTEIYKRDGSIRAIVPLYTAPPQRDETSAKTAEWVGLTDEEITELWEAPGDSGSEFARAIEAKIKGKNYDKR